MQLNLSLSGCMGTGQFSTMMWSERSHRDGGPNHGNRKSEKRERSGRKRPRKIKRGREADPAERKKRGNEREKTKGRHGER